MKPAESIVPTVVNTPKRLPTAKELFGVLPSKRTDPIVAPIQGGLVRNRAILPLPSRRIAVPKSRKPKPSENTYKSNIPGVSTRQWATAGPSDNGTDVDDMTDLFEQMSVSNTPIIMRTGSNIFGVTSVGGVSRKRSFYLTNHNVDKL